MFAESFIFFLTCTCSTFGITGKKTMYHQVRVTADRRGEGGVIVECQSVVTNIVSTILRFHHGTQRDILYKFLNFITTNVCKQVIDALCYVSLCALGFYIEFESFYKLSKVFQFSRI